MTVAHVEDAFPSQLLSWLSTLAVGTTVCLFLTGFEICWRIKVCFYCFWLFTNLIWCSVSFEISQTEAVAYSWYESGQWLWEPVNLLFFSMETWKRLAVEGSSIYGKDLEILNLVFFFDRKYFVMYLSWVYY